MFPVFFRTAPKLACVLLLLGSAIASVPLMVTHYTSHPLSVPRALSVPSAVSAHAKGLHINERITTSSSLKAQQSEKRLVLSIPSQGVSQVSIVTSWASAALCTVLIFGVAFVQQVKYKSSTEPNYYHMAANLGRHSSGGQDHPYQRLTPYDYVTRTPWASWFKALCRSSWLHGAADRDLLTVQPATHGRGVFALCAIAPDTVLGLYPGVRRPPWEVTDKNRYTDGRSQFYVVMCDDGWLLDPTNDEGVLVGPPAEVAWGPVSRDATLALVNEPSGDAEARSTGANCVLEELSTGVFEFRTSCWVMAGEELLLDYGENYGDRSHYIVNE